MEDVTAERVYATTARTSTQQVAPALMGQASIHYPSAQASLVFDGHTRFDRLDRTYVTGSKGSIRSCGPDTNDQRLELVTADGVAKPKIQGDVVSRRFSRHDGRVALRDRRESRADQQRPEQSRQPVALLCGGGQCGERQTGRAGHRAKTRHEWLAGEGVSRGGRQLVATRRPAGRARRDAPAR